MPMYYAPRMQERRRAQRFRVRLVLERIAPGCQVRLQGQGRVVRVEPCRGGAEVAMDIMAYRLDSHVCTCRGCRGTRGGAQARA
jgi:hypothetical protein